MKKKMKNDKSGLPFKSYDCNTVQLLDNFMHTGPNGTHYVMAFEILGVNLLEIIKRYDYKGIPIPLIRVLAKQCLIGIDYLNRICSLIHTDLKPENVVIALTQAELKEIYGNGCLATNKIFKKDANKKARAVAGANDELLVSTRDPKAEQILSPKPVPFRHKSTERYENMDTKGKKKYRKMKRKREKKYIT
jgi:serine/threonine-protein kinase SRPK3